MGDVEDVYYQVTSSRVGSAPFTSRRRPTAHVRDITGCSVVLFSFLIISASIVTLRSASAATLPTGNSLFGIPAFMRSARCRIALAVGVPALGAGCAVAGYTLRGTVVQATEATPKAKEIAETNPASSGITRSVETIGEIQSSGLFFKDTIKVHRILDPKISGVTLYQTDFDKPAFEKMTSGNFEEPGASGLSCAIHGKVLAKPDISKHVAGEVIFSESKAWMGKTLKITRIYDEKAKNIVYVVYTERLTKGKSSGSRFQSQVCAVALDGFQDLS